MLSAGDNILNMFLHLRSERATLTPRPTVEKTRPSRAHGDREKESFQREAMATDASSQRSGPPSKVLFPKRISTFPSAPRRYFSFRSTKATSEIYDLHCRPGEYQKFFHSLKRREKRRKHGLLLFSTYMKFPLCPLCSHPHPHPNHFSLKWKDPRLDQIG